MVKRFVKQAVVLSLCLCLLIPCCGFGEPSQSIQLEGEGLGEPGVFEDGVLYLPLRKVCEHLGYRVSWSQPEEVVTLSKPESKIELFQRDNKIIANGQEVYDSWKTLNGKNYMREEFFADFLGLKVVSDGSSINITHVQENPITITAKKEIINADMLNSTVQYPEITGLAAVEIEQKINGEIKALARQAKEEGLKNAEEMKQWAESGNTGSPM